MDKQTLQAAVIQKSIELSEQEALKVLVFMAGLEAGKKINGNYTEKSSKNGSEKTCG